MAPVHYHADSPFPPDIDWKQMVSLIGPANAAVAKYDALIQSIPNPNVLLSPLTTQEAALSSKIEGTQATMTEVLQFDADEEIFTSPTKQADIQEVINYRRALLGAAKTMDSVPLSQRLIKTAHTSLMQGVRGAGKSPGEYRRVPNWIGPEGSPVEHARYVPPNADRIADLMSRWEKYLHSDALDSLVQLAVIHAEFESIHPFLDGNGRLGRLIVPLFLVHKGILENPNFYLSAYLESHRDEYYDSLLAVSSKNDWTGWCAFFLRAVIEQAEANQAKAKAILNLYEEKKDWIATIARSQHAVRALDWFFSRPIFKTPDFVSSTKIPDATANRIVKVVRDAGLLVVVREPSGSSPAILAFAELLNIAEGRSVFASHP